MTMGRPRGFDLDAVLEAALGVFWAKGFEGTTMADLTTATGLRSGSVYAAFGSKTGLFEQVVDHYGKTIFSYGPAALQAPTAREVAARWLRGAVEATTADDSPAGCLMVQGALATGEQGTQAQASLRSRRRAGEAALVERMVQARAAGDLPNEVDPTVAARYVMTLSVGIAVQAASGASRTELRELVDLAVAQLSWR